MILPVVDETFAAHFTANAWATPSAQVAAGFPIYIQPTNATAKFVYTHDVGTVLVDNCLITIAAPMQQIVPTVTITCKIETSPDNVTYTTRATGLFQAFTGNFRYIRVTLDFAAANNHYLAICGPVRLRITLKNKRDAGNGTSSATLATTVTFNQAFIDIHSITVTAAYNASYPTTAVYDFTDAPYPTTFKVYCFRTDTGAQIANAFSWSAEGV